RSVCPFDCPDACGMLVEVEGGRAVGVRGDPDHPFNRGTLCPKMAHYERSVHSDLRLATPLRRVGPKGEGPFEPLSWAEALDEIAARWKAIRGRWGGEAILPYSYAGTMGLVQRNAGHAFFHRLGASRLDRTICTPAKGAGLAAVLGSTPAPDPEAVLGADLVVLWGLHALATNLHGFQRVREARRRGAQVWAVETHRTATTDHADHVILVRPGTDGVLAAGVMRLLLEAGALDRAFLDRHVLGFEALAREVLPLYPPEVVAAATGVGEAALRAFAEAYGRAADPQIQLGGGITRYGNGAMTTRLILCLPALVGAYLKPAGGAFLGTSTGGAFPMAKLLREDFQPGPTRLVNMNRLGDALGPGLDPPVKALYVYHANPAAVAPDQTAVRAGLAREDLFTVVHERFLTDTARYADLVLPATSSLEHPDLYRSYGHYGVQKVAAALPPQGESRSNWRTFQALAAHMGFEEPFFRQDEDALIEALLSEPNPWLQDRDREALAEGRPARLTPPRLPPPFGTPSGQVEILNSREPEPLPRPLPCHSMADPEPLALVTAPSLYSLNSTFHEREDLPARGIAATLRLAPGDAEARGIRGGDEVTAFNSRGEVHLTAEVTGRVPEGVVVVEGVAWSAFSKGRATVNALTSQRLTDRGGGSTFYDHRVDVRRRA
ncbi:MAG: molybdopterin-dependent oxidoreductase, partial [Geothrix sp.]|nr:molybdopterin-dependent oxidoreductase [Geothrix sp.]